jgi:Icc-related predicted phosphoesterase
MAKAFLFSDLHCRGKYLSILPELIAENKEIKVLIFAGDVVNMGEPVWFAEKFVETTQKIGLPLLWVPGNNDFGRSYYKINAKYKSLEGRVVELFERKFTGVGGSPASWSGQYAGENMVDRKKIGGSIFVSHVPPPGILTLQQKDLPSPTSNKKFSDFPLVHICGHIHYRWGTAYLGQTKVIQLASLETGHYAIMDLETLKVDFGRIR